MSKKETIITKLLDEQLKEKMEELFRWYEREKRKEQKLKVIKF
jgi:hypothetical protein